MPFKLDPRSFLKKDRKNRTDIIEAKEQVIPVVCNHNCGGRCLLKAHVKDGRIVRMSTDDAPDDEKRPQLRACLKGLSSHNRLYHPDRLTYPLRRAGKRGEGKFTRIPWDEAIAAIVQNLKAILGKYGNQAVYIQYGTGDRGAISGRFCVKRLMNLLGGFLEYYNTYSSACLNYTAPFVTGIRDSNTYETMVHSKLIILNGFNPAETVFETNSNFWLARAREAGAKVIVIDPIFSETAATFSDQWIPLKPTTDTALFIAMAYVIIKENLHHQEYIDKYCLGFDEEHMPPGIPPGNSFCSYVFGLADGQPKTPEWAERITGIDARTIRNLAIEYAVMKPAQLIQGLGPQRHAQGESSVRAGIVLSSITGNLGILGGGWGGGESGRKCGLQISNSIPTGANPVKTQIPVFLWTDAVVRGTQMTAADGVRNGPLQSNIKFIWNTASNTLLNQHADINRTMGILRDENLIQFIVAEEQFMTPSARFADLVLPADHSFERCDLGYPWSGDNYVLLGSGAVEPPGECRHAYGWVSRIAEEMGVGHAFTEGKTVEDWVKHIVEEARQKNPGFPTWEELKETGCYRQDAQQYVAFAKEIQDPVNHPFPTPSGKIEIFSQTLYEMNHAEIPGVPKYIPAWEGPDDPLRQRYPLQCIGPHTKRRVHSIFDENPWMEEAEPQAVWVSLEDAAARGIADGDCVKMFNDRGAIMTKARLTKRIRPGVVAVPQGAWYAPDADGVCRRGCVNVLTSMRPTPLAHGNAQHTLLVEMIKV